MKYVGTKEVLKAVLEQKTKKVYISKNADMKVVSDIINLCNEKNISLEYVDTMDELGKMSGIDVGAATAAE